MRKRMKQVRTRQRVKTLPGICSRSRGSRSIQKLLGKTAAAVWAVSAALFIALGIYLSAVLAGGLIPAPQRDNSTEIEGNLTAAPESRHTIYLLSNGVHIELCLPLTAQLEPEIARRLPIGKRSDYYVCFGWGDREFYPGTPTIEELAVLPSLQSLFLPTPGAMLIGLYRESVLLPYSEAVEISETQLRRLYDYVQEYIIWKQENGKKAPAIIEPGKISSGYQTDFFIEAAGTYSLFFTCNNWTNSALKYAGIPTSLWTPLAWRIGR